LRKENNIYWSCCSADKKQDDSPHDNVTPEGDMTMSAPRVRNL